MKPHKTWIILLSLIIIISGISIIIIHSTTILLYDINFRLMLLIILSINILALVTLVFFVGKNIYRLYYEKQQGVLGHKFRLRLVSIFIIVIIIPSIFLFITASGLATTYIEQIFSSFMKRPFDKMIDLAGNFYDLEKARLLKITRQIRDGKTINIEDITIHKYLTLPNDAQEILKDAFAGKESSEIVSSKQGDIIRVAVPDKSKNKGIIVAEHTLPKSISEKSEELRMFYEDYLKFQSFKEPLRWNFIIVLGFVTLMVIFIGLWLSIKISSDMTIPIQKLAEATGEISLGNFNIYIDIKSEDEIGLLISSFNLMVKQLKGNKESLDKAYLELENRWLYLERILQNITSGVIFFDNTGKIIIINNSACSILNISSDQIKGKNYRDLLLILNSADLSTIEKDIQYIQKTIVKKIRIRIKDRHLILNIHISKIAEIDNSKIFGILIVFDNITDVIKEEKALTIQEMSRMLAHEIRNPLTPIKLATERLIRKWVNKDKDFAPVFEKSTKIIIDEVESLKRLVDAFSKFGKMPEIHKDLTNPYELIESTVNLYKGFNELKIKVNIQKNIPLIWLDKEQFKRVLINILDNAIKAMQNKGIINIDIKTDNGNMLVDIADTGIGIKEEEREKLFLPEISKHPDGTGFGLAISHKIIKEHNGKITVKNNIPKGTILSIEIPI